METAAFLRTEKWSHRHGNVYKRISLIWNIFLKWHECTFSFGGQNPNQTNYTKITNKNKFVEWLKFVKLFEAIHQERMRQQFWFKKQSPANRMTARIGTVCFKAIRISFVVNSLFSWNAKYIASIIACSISAPENLREHLLNLRVL